VPNICLSGKLFPIIPPPSGSVNEFQNLPKGQLAIDNGQLQQLTVIIGLDA